MYFTVSADVILIVSLNVTLYVTWTRQTGSTYEAAQRLCVALLLLSWLLLFYNIVAKEICLK